MNVATEGESLPSPHSSISNWTRKMRENWSVSFNEESGTEKAQRVKGRALKKIELSCLVLGLIIARALLHNLIVWQKFLLSTFYLL